jgi:hypothetical protein
MRLTVMLYVHCLSYFELFSSLSGTLHSFLGQRPTRMQIGGEFQWQNYISSIKSESPYEPHRWKIFQCRYHASTYPLKSSI